MGERRGERTREERGKGKNRFVYAATERTERVPLGLTSTTVLVIVTARSAFAVVCRNQYVIVLILSDLMSGGVMCACVRSWRSGWWVRYVGTSVFEALSSTWWLMYPSIELRKCTISECSLTIHELHTPRFDECGEGHAAAPIPCKEWLCSVYESLLEVSRPVQPTVHVLRDLHHTQMERVERLMQQTHKRAPRKTSEKGIFRYEIIGYVRIHEPPSNLSLPKSVSDSVAQKP